MAIRKKLNHDDKTREKIQTSQILNRLTNHVLGKVEMSASQVTAALGLIRKTLPDLQAIELKAEVEQIQRVVSSEPLTINEWSDKYGSDLETSSGATKSLN